MKQLFIIANWKSNKTELEAKKWIQEVLSIKDQGLSIEKEIIICPSFPCLTILKSYILNHHSLIKLGAQNISPFDEGAYTGEVNVKQIKEFADYVLIGHSERRKNFGETEETVVQKINMTTRYNLISVLCISDLSQLSNVKIQNDDSNQNNLIIAYEPLFAIGSGQADIPENADQIAAEIKKELNNVSVLYGGSVTSENVSNFTKMPNIDGVLVGGASLDPLEFSKIIKNA